MPADSGRRPRGGWPAERQALEETAPRAASDVQGRVVDSGGGSGYARTTMTAIVSSFLEVGGAPYRYTFLLVVRNVYEDALETS